MTTSGPSLGSFIALQHVVRLVDFPLQCANPFPVRGVRSLLPRPSSHLLGQERSIRLSISYKQCQFTTTTGPSLGSFIALQNVVRLIDFPHRCANPFPVRGVKSLPPRPSSHLLGKKRSIRLSTFYKVCNRRQMGHLSPFPTVDSSLDVRPFARLSTIPSVTLALPRRVTTVQEKIE